MKASKLVALVSNLIAEHGDKDIMVTADSGDKIVSNLVVDFVVPEALRPNEGWVDVTEPGVTEGAQRFHLLAGLPAAH